MKICFITSVFGNSYDDIDKPSYFNTINNYDYYLFTNLPIESFKTSWNVINIQHINVNIESNIIKSRYPKFMAWKLIEHVIQKDYDIIFYCDSYLCPKENIKWELLGNDILKHPSGLLHQIHIRDAYQELDIIVKERKDNQVRRDKTVDFLKKNNFPKRQIMSENCVFGYNPNDETLRNAFIDFWNEFSPYEKSHRDQPLWSYILWKHQITPLLMQNTYMRNVLVQRNGTYGFNGHCYT